MTTPITAEAHAPRRIYYGWKVVAALFLAGFMVYGGGLYCFVLFVPRMTEEFGWSHAATSGLLSVFWLTAPLLLLGGHCIKRVGMVPLLVGGIVLEAACVMVLAALSSLWQMYLLRVLMGLGKVMFAVTLPYAISKWFSRHFSLGLGLAWAGWHVGGLVLAPIASAIIEHYGWRTACTTIGVGLLTVGLIPILVTLRIRSPRALGMGLDGEPLTRSGAAVEDTASSLPTGTSDTPHGSLGAVVRSPAFWLVAVVTLLYYCTYGGLLAEEAVVVEGAGFTPRLASLVLGSTAGFAAVGGLVAGSILDRYSIRVVGWGVHLVILVGALALLAVAHLHSVAALVAYAVAFGIAIGASDLYFVALLRRRFSTISVAYIYSAWYFCELSTLFVAPIVIGHVFDVTASYDFTVGLLVACAAFAMLLGVPAMRTPPQLNGADAR
ncbi:MAG TPA: MFS transporter [Steroidobacteraceae bacterium]|nr:MFS transporter [Steroidobacteraceae bacterium]